MSNKKQIDALQTLILGSTLNKKCKAECALINQEFDEVVRVEKVTPLSRSLLLQVLHSTRALDTTLQTFLIMHNCCTGNSLGGYLYDLKNHKVLGLGTISEKERNNFQTSIVNKRNKYMHKAGTFPINEREVSVLLSQMRTCLNRALYL